jgi:hypothetical protein
MRLLAFVLACTIIVACNALGEPATNEVKAWVDVKCAACQLGGHETTG